MQPRALSAVLLLKLLAAQEFDILQTCDCVASDPYQQWALPAVGAPAAPVTVVSDPSQCWGFEQDGCAWSKWCLGLSTDCTATFNVTAGPLVNSAETVVLTYANNGRDGAPSIPGYQGGPICLDQARDTLRVEAYPCTPADRQQEWVYDSALYSLSEVWSGNDNCLCKGPPKASATPSVTPSPPASATPSSTRSRSRSPRASASPSGAPPAAAAAAPAGLSPGAAAGVALAVLVVAGAAGAAAFARFAPDGAARIARAGAALAKAAGLGAAGAPAAAERTGLLAARAAAPLSADAAASRFGPTKAFAST
jgi:hypothetical protein